MAHDFLDGEFNLRLPDVVNYRGQASVVKGRWRNYEIDSLGGTALWNGSRLELHSMRVQKAGQTAAGEFWLQSGMARRTGISIIAFRDGSTFH